MTEKTKKAKKKKTIRKSKQTEEYFVTLEPVRRYLKLQKPRNGQVPRISNRGRYINSEGKTRSLRRKKYPTVLFCGQYIDFHRLVGYGFHLGQLKRKLVKNARLKEMDIHACHKDGNCRNNTKANIKWGTPGENMREKDATLPRYVWKTSEKLDRRVGGKHWCNSGTAAAKKVKVSKSTISIVCANHKGKCKVKGYYVCTSKLKKR
jgi:hypothetical protein